jgi:hypothetical protein
MSVVPHRINFVGQTLVIYTLSSIIPPSIMSLPLLYLETLGNRHAQFITPSLLSHLALINHKFWLVVIHQRIQTTCSTHHIVITVLVIIIVLLTLCYSIMSHIRLVLYYHASMSALHTSLIIMCTLVATCMLLRRLECIPVWYCLFFNLGNRWYRFNLKTSINNLSTLLATQSHGADT